MSATSAWSSLSSTASSSEAVTSSFSRQARTRGSLRPARIDDVGRTPGAATGRSREAKSSTRPGAL